MLTITMLNFVLWAIIFPSLELKI